MPSLNETRESLEVAFVDGWAEATPIKYNNSKFSDKNIDAFVSIKMINYTPGNVCVGSDVTKRIRHEGVFAVKIYTKQNIGDGSAYNYADKISGIMSNLSQNNLSTIASKTRRNSEAPDGWFGLIVDTPYSSDEA